MDTCTVISSFKRYEVKYFITPQQYAAILPELRRRFVLDEHGRYTVSNIYFDTDNYEIIRASIEKPVYKEKLRVRAYTTPDPETGRVFVELKTKYRGVVYKRRIMVSVPEARAFLDRGVFPAGADPQITREIARFLDMYHPTPKVVLCYDRTGMICAENPDLRLTFDRNLRWRQEELSLTRGDWGSPILPGDDRIVMEVKIPGVMPLWMARLLSENGIHRTSFSKIGTCYKKYILPQKFAKKAVNV